VHLELHTGYIPRESPVFPPHGAVPPEAEMLRTIFFRPLMGLARVLRKGAENMELVAVKGLSKREGGGSAHVPRTIIHDGEAIQELEGQKQEMLHGIIDMGETVAREVMVPRTDMVTVKAGSTMREVMETTIKAGHSRIPVYEDKIDNIIGILYSKDLLNVCLDEGDHFSLEKIIRPAYFIPESKPLAVLLNEFQRNRVHIAIVVDEYGGTAGLVTLEDILEEIIGEIEDEYDETEERVVRLESGDLLLDARLEIEAVEDLLDIRIEKEEFESIGGLAIHVLGHLPRQGENFIHQGFRFVIEKATDRKVVKVRVEKVNDED
jgi:magnesium and cobalt transporter